jgi:hypothetical protein
MSDWDDDDWVGEPPEGRYSRDRADPGYWRRVHIPPVAGAAVVVILLILLIVWLT